MQPPVRFRPVTHCGRGACHNHGTGVPAILEPTGRFQWRHIGVMRRCARNQTDQPSLHNRRIAPTAELAPRTRPGALKRFDSPDCCPASRLFAGSASSRKRTPLRLRTGGATTTITTNRCLRDSTPTKPKCKLKMQNLAKNLLCHLGDTSANARKRRRAAWKLTLVARR